MPASFRYLTDGRFHLNSMLAKWRDGRYYTAAVVKCNKEAKKCLVCFEDGSEHWLQSRDIHIQLSYDNMDLEEDLVCSICDDGKSEPLNEIVLCDVCQQGYHQKCHIPAVDDSKLDESDSDKHQDWMCSTCYYILHQPTGTQSAPTTSGEAGSIKRANNNNSGDSKSVARHAVNNDDNKIVKEKLTSTKTSNNRDNSGVASGSGTKQTPTKNAMRSDSKVVSASAVGASRKTPSSSNNSTAVNSSNSCNNGSGKNVTGSNNNNNMHLSKTNKNDNNFNATKSIPKVDLQPSSPASSVSSIASDGSSSNDALEIVTKPSFYNNNRNEKHGRTKPKLGQGPPPQKAPSSTPVKHAVRKSAINHIIPQHQTSTNTMSPTKSAQQQSQHQKSPISNQSTMQIASAHSVPKISGTNITVTSTAATNTTEPPKTSPTATATNRVATTTKTKSITAIADNLRVVSKKPKLVKTPPPPACGANSNYETKPPTCTTLTAVPSTPISTPTISITSNTSPTDTASIACQPTQVVAPIRPDESSRLHLMGPASFQVQQQPTPILNQNKQQQVVPDQVAANSVEAPPVENVVDQLIPRPENFEGDNNPFVDL